MLSETKSDNALERLYTFIVIFPYVKAWDCCYSGLQFTFDDSFQLSTRALSVKLVKSGQSQQHYGLRLG